MMKKIDVKKLRSLGVPEEVIAGMDIRDGGNIDANGNVLFLDEERQKSKENPNKPLRKNKPNGLGIRNAVFEKFSGKLNDPKQDSGVAFNFMLEIQAAPQNSLRHKLVYNMMGFGPKGYTGGTILPLDLDFSKATKSEILPIDLGCVFLNAAGGRVVKVGAAVEATVEEAKAQVLRAKDAGLFCCAERVDGEQLI